jgi:hypothetical protein
VELDDKLRKLIENLGVAINDALSDAEDVRHAIASVREAGYDVFLVLEATIGVRRRGPEGSAEDDDAGGETETSPAPGQVRLRVNDQDMKFLRSLKIRVDDLDSHQ